MLIGGPCGVSGPTRLAGLRTVGDGSIQQMALEYCYHPRVFEELGRFGLRPLPTTPPQQAKAFVNDLYRHELRRLRTQLRSGEIPSVGYADRVVALRKKYFLLSIRLDLWTVPDAPIRRL